MRAVSFLIAQLLLSTLSSAAIDPGPVPVPDPARPKPYFSWDYIPLAFHGANRSGVYNQETVEVLGKHYQLVSDFSLR